MAQGNADTDADASLLASPPSDRVLDQEQENLKSELRTQRVGHWESESQAVSDSNDLKSSANHGRSLQDQTGNAIASALNEWHDDPTMGEV
jgi:hypothetical protein